MSDWLFVIGLCAPPFSVVTGFIGLLLVARPADHAQTGASYRRREDRPSSEASLLPRPRTI